MTTATNNIVINVTSTGTPTVQRNLQNIGDSANSSANAVDRLKQALGGLGAALALNQIRQWMDAWTQATGIVNIFSHSAQETAQVMEQIYQIAQNTRQPLDATAQSYHKMSVVAGALGASQQDLLTVTEAVNKAFAIQKTPAATARGTLIQFSQAMGSGIVRAQEFNSMLMGMPQILKIVAANIDGANGSVAKLRQIMLAGELKSKDFFAALLKGAPQLNEMFDKSGRTIGQAFTIADNAMTKYVGSIDQAYGISRTFFDIVKFGADNIDTLAKSITVLATPALVLAVIALFNAIVGGLQAVAAWMLANPFTAIATAIATAIVALTLWRDQIVLVQQDQVTLGDYMRASWDMIKQAAGDAANYLQDNFGGLLEGLQGLAGVVIDSFMAILTSAKDLINKIIALWVSVYNVVMAVWDEFPAALKDVFYRALNQAINVVNSGVGTIVDIINSVAKKAGVATIDFKPFDNLISDVEGSAKALGDTIKNSVRDAFSTDYLGQAGDAFLKAFDTLNEKAREKARIRQQIAQQQPVDLTQPMGSGETFGAKPKKVADESEALASQLLTLMKTLKPGMAAVDQMRFAQEVLNNSLEAGYITLGQYNELLTLLPQHYQDIIDPMGKYLRDQQQELAGLKLTSAEQAIQNEVYKVTQDMKKKGVILTSEEVAKIRELQIEINAQKEVQSELNKIYSDTFDKRNNLVAQQEALNMAMQQGALSVDQYNQKLVQLGIAWANFRLQQGNGDFTDVITSSLGKLVEGYQGILPGLSSAFGDFFKSFTDGFADSVGQAIVYSNNLDEALQNVAKQAVAALISALIKLGIQWAVNAALGQSLGAASLAASTAASAAAGAATAAAWAPAAAMASLASFGANSGPAMAGIAATTSLSQSLALSSMLGFQTGGYTGDGATNAVAGLVHGQEYVFDAQSTAAIGVNNLDALRRNALSSGGSSAGGSLGGGGNVYISVVNNANATVSTQQSTDDQGNVNLLMIVDPVEQMLASRIDSGNSKLGRAIQNTYGLKQNPRNG